jgi:hypothetical protein
MSFPFGIRCWLNEVQFLAKHPRFAKRKKALRLCLHHVADAVTARALFLDDGFDPDALHLSAFSTLLDDFLLRLPQLNAADAQAQLRKLGFLAGPIPNPIVDGPKDSDAYATSGDRCAAKIVQFLCDVFPAQALAQFRPEIAEHLRKTYTAKAHLFLVERWSKGEIHAVAAIAAISRLGWPQLVALVGQKMVEELVNGFVFELGEIQGIRTNQRRSSTYLISLAHRTNIISGATPCSTSVSSDSMVVDASLLPLRLRWLTQ